VLVDVHRAFGARPRGTRLVLLSDFDGTLAEFDVDPAAPHIRSDARAALVALSTLSDISLGLVSGRRVADLVQRVALPREVYMAGLHGLEIAVAERFWQHEAVAAAQDAATELTRVLAAVLADVRGCRVEAKGASVAVHVRAVPRLLRAEVLARADAAAAPWIRSRIFRCLVGADVHEYLPAAGWSKGEAVRLIAHDVERRTGQTPWVAYFGDDLTDEDAFRAADLSVVVGRRASGARYQLDSPADVAMALADLAVSTAAEGHW
jgi:trehalose 6-phosphate phosphatase